MVRVMASGVFDIIHIGHISYLEQAKAMGDELVVVVACDETAKKRKREPIMPESARMRMINSLKPVDIAVMGDGGDMFATIEKIRPDIIVLGFDQNFDETELKNELAKRDIRAEVIRASEHIDDLTSTRRMIDRIVKRFGDDTR